MSLPLWVVYAKVLGTQKITLSGFACHPSTRREFFQQSKMSSLAPGATLGVLGGGQLGLMFVNSAHKMGYRCVVWDPSDDSPAGRIADRHTKQPFSDNAVCHWFAHECDAATLEFENVPVQLIRRLEQHELSTIPSAYPLSIAQDRIVEKTFIADAGVATTPFYPIRCTADINKAFEYLSSPLILKTARLGYDGKGQRMVDSVAQATSAFDEMKRVPCVAESYLQLASEISVVLSRSQQGICTFFPVAENVHKNGILHLSRVPASISESLQKQAQSYARRIADALEYQGVIAVEFFVKDTEQGGELFVNEIAPRPHNTGHYTLDACLSSQFDQQLRMMCNLPASDTQLLKPVVMVNLLGDLWKNGELKWDILPDDPQLRLHLYGKRHPLRNRKMGHFCLLGEDFDIDINALQSRAEQYHQALQEYALQ